jgi:hypothetical protein
MASVHWGGESESYLTHKCKNCGDSTGHALHHDIEPHLCKTCKLVEERDKKINSLLEDKKWWKVWK